LGRGQTDRRQEHKADFLEQAISPQNSRHCADQIHPNWPYGSGLAERCQQQVFSSRSRDWRAGFPVARIRIPACFVAVGGGFAGQLLVPAALAPFTKDEPELSKQQTDRKTAFNV
jgi:hypothetical protein